MDGDDDWDLFAVVRSCTNSTAASSSSCSINPVAVNDFHVPEVIDLDDKDIIDESFQGLEEIYKELFSPNFSGSVPGEFQLDQRKIQAPPDHEQQVQPAAAGDQLVVQGQNQHLHIRHGIVGSSSPPQPAAAGRPRRRKNQQTKTVHQMTQEELSGDSWAWRKYGQKPIKGSPYPRNYYRCSTSKGCSARKQVERCPTDPNIFVVSYSGEHTHPRPTHRSSLAGSTRSKLSPSAKQTSTSAATTSINTAAQITSSPPTSATISPTTPIIGGESEGEENIENDNAEISGNNIIEEEEEEEEDQEGNDDEEDILIPNNFITDDILKGFQELSGGGGGVTNNNGSDSSGTFADKSSCSLLSPPWTPTSSTAGGGC